MINKKFLNLFLLGFTFFNINLFAGITELRTGKELINNATTEENIYAAIEQLSNAFEEGKTITPATWEKTLREALASLYSKTNDIGTSEENIESYFKRIIDLIDKANTFFERAKKRSGTWLNEQRKRFLNLKEGLLKLFKQINDTKVDLDQKNKALQDILNRLREEIIVLRGSGETEKATLASRIEAQAKEFEYRMKQILEKNATLEAQDTKNFEDLERLVNEQEQLQKQNEALAKQLNQALQQIREEQTKTSKAQQESLESGMRAVQAEQRASEAEESLKRLSDEKIASEKHLSDQNEELRKISAQIKRNTNERIEAQKAHNAQEIAALNKQNKKLEYEKKELIEEITRSQRIAEGKGTAFVAAMKNTIKLRLEIIEILMKKLESLKGTDSAIINTLRKRIADIKETFNNSSEKIFGPNFNQDLESLKKLINDQITSHSEISKTEQLNQVIKKANDLLSIQKPQGSRSLRAAVSSSSSSLTAPAASGPQEEELTYEGIAELIEALITKVNEQNKINKELITRNQALILIAQQAQLLQSPRPDLEKQIKEAQEETARIKKGLEDKGL